MQRNNILKGTAILTTHGQDLGRLVDLYFNDRTGKIEGYEVSGGLFADAYTGRSFVPAPKALKIGEDYAFVPPETAALMEEQVGGIKAAMITASEKVQSAAQTTTESVQAASQEASVRLQEASQEASVRLQAASEKLQDRAQVVGAQLQANAEQAGEKLYALRSDLQASAAQATASYAVEETLGRRVQRTVRTSEGIFIAVPGQIVTHYVIEQAKFHKREQDLLEAVGLSTKDAAQSTAKAQLGLAGDRVSSVTASTTQTLAEQATYGAEKFKIEARNLWENLKGGAQDLKERGNEAIEEKRIRGALGRPVTRVILDEHDQVILNVGDLITHQAIAAARYANVLDILLDSVYNQVPQISQVDMRAPQMGRASLEMANGRSN
jgi:sporulation protein YlmC with PRC-barrel domain